MPSSNQQRLPGRGPETEKDSQIEKEKGKPPKPFLEVRKKKGKKGLEIRKKEKKGTGETFLHMGTGDPAKT